MLVHVSKCGIRSGTYSLQEDVGIAFFMLQVLAILQSFLYLLDPNLVDWVVIEAYRLQKSFMVVTALLDFMSLTLIGLRFLDVVPGGAS